MKSVKAVIRSKYPKESDSGGLKMRFYVEIEKIIDVIEIIEIIDIHLEAHEGLLASS